MVQIAPKKNSTGLVEVGMTAKNRAHMKPECTIFVIKKLMGEHMTEAEIKERNKELTFELVLAPGDQPVDKTVKGEDLYIPKIKVEGKNG